MDYAKKKEEINAKVAKLQKALVEVREQAMKLEQQYLKLAGQLELLEEFTTDDKSMDLDI